jgi:putative ABC transport system permease protein
MNGLLQDFRYALRQFRKNPGFCTTVVLTLALAIGVATAVFSVFYAMLIRPLPYDHPDRIFFLQTWSPQGYTQPASYPEYLDWRRETHLLETVAGFAAVGSANLQGPSGPVALPKISTTDNFFEVFGVSPYLGRTFAEGEDQPGRNDVALLSYEVWRQHFGSQRSIIGQTIKLDGLPHIVIGVMPAGFRYPVNVRSAVYTPLHMPKELAGARGSHWLQTIARIKGGTPREQAQADMDRVLNDLGRAFPASKGRRMQLVSLGASIVGDVEAPLKTLIFAVLALLAIACVNVAGLLLAHGVHRQREIALRSAVGAARFRIVRQLLTEVLLLACLGALGGTIVAHLLLDAVRALLVTALARGAAVRLDISALLVALGLAVLTSVAAGLAPALRLSSVAPNLSLKTGSGAASTRSQYRLRSGFIMAQVGLALVLLVTSGLLLRVLATLRGTDLGFDPEGILTCEIDLSPAAYEGREVIANFYQPLLERVRAIPGVRAAGLIDILPIQNWGSNSDIHIIGHPPDPPDQERLAETRIVSPDYFSAFGSSLARGRLLDERVDTPNSQPVIVVNEAFVKKFFAEGEDPIGKYVEGWMSSGAKLRIVGVARSIRQNIYQPPMAEMDFSFSQIPPKDTMLAVPSMWLAVRTTSEPLLIVPSLRRVFHELDPSLPFREPLTMSQVVADVLVFERLENWLFGTFAVLAVLLAVIGLYGFISHEVELSTHDIGVRMALGATRIAVLGSVCRRIGSTLLGGVIAGLVITAAVQKLISAVVAIHALRDAEVIIGLAAGLFIAGMLAVFAPARRAASVDPIVALRYE